MGNESNVHIHARHWFPACDNKFLSEHWKSKQIDIPVTHQTGTHADTVTYNFTAFFWNKRRLVQHAYIGYRSCDSYRGNTCATIQRVEKREK